MTLFATQSDDSRDREDRQHELIPTPPGTLSYLWSHTSALKEVLRAVQVVGAWPGVTIASTQSGLCVSVGGVVLGHLSWNGRIDLRVAREVRGRLLSEELVGTEPDKRHTDRVAFDVCTVAEINRALWLLLLAYLSVDSKLAAIPICGKSGIDHPLERKNKSDWPRSTRDPHA